MRFCCLWRLLLDVLRLIIFGLLDGLLLQKKKSNGSVIVSDKQLLQRAWDSLAIWKETYSEGWDEDDEQLLDDLIARLAQPQREWKGLTDEEIDELAEANLDFNWKDGVEDFARAIEAKLKEKNT